MKNMLINFTYSFDCHYKASIGEENEEDRDEEVDNEHVNDKWFIVEAWSQSVVVRSTGALHALRKVPAWGLRRTNHVFILQQLKASDLCGLNGLQVNESSSR